MKKYNIGDLVCLERFEDPSLFEYAIILRNSKRDLYYHGLMYLLTSKLTLLISLSEFNGLNIKSVQKCNLKIS